MPEDTPTTLIRRVVTGVDTDGRSCVVWDGPATNVHEASGDPRRNYADLWAWDHVPAPLDGPDDGDLMYDFPGPPNGGHLRVSQMRPRPADYDAAADSEIEEPHDPFERPAGRAWDRGGKNLFSSNMHMTQTIDYGIVLSGECELMLDDADLLVRAGDIVVQLASWHQWSSPRIGCQMAFDMFAATLTPEQRSAALAEGHHVSAERTSTNFDGPGPRRIVTAAAADGTSTLVSDGPAPHVLIDPARPGFTSAYIWSTDGSPAPAGQDSARRLDAIEPSSHGSLCRVITVPPDRDWIGGVGAEEVAAYFRSTGSPGASTYDPHGRHPYMQRTRSLDFVFVLQGEVTLLLETAEVNLRTGDCVVQRGTNHAWSNHSEKPAVLSLTAHAGA